VRVLTAIKRYIASSLAFGIFPNDVQRTRPFRSCKFNQERAKSETAALLYVGR
jgi:hypothetical protein